MPKSTLSKHLVNKRKVVESLSQPSPLLPAVSNSLVKQQQVSAIGTRTPIPSTPGHFPKATKVTTQGQEDGITHNHTCSNSATKRKQIPRAPKTQNTSQ